MYFLFTPRHHPVFCGVADHTVLLAQQLRQAGAGEVAIVTLTPAAKGQPGVTVANTTGHWWRHWAAQHSGAVWLWQYSPYALHPRGTPWWVVRAMWQLRRAGIRQAIFFHEVQIRYSLPGLYNKLRALQQQLIANLCARLAGGRVATSIPLYQTYFWGKKPPLIPISPNLLPQPGIAPVPMRVVAFANRLYPFLLQALAAVQQQLPALQVLWLGKKAPDALDAAAIVQTYGLQSAFTGALPAEALAAQLQAASLVLLPLQTDKRGRGGISLKSGTLSAALAMGKPVIASPGDMTETALLRHGSVLHLPGQNTVDDWQQAIALLLQDTAYANRLGEGGLQFFQQHLTWPHTALAIQKLFDDAG